MYAWLEVSRSGYYAWRGAEPSQRSRDDSARIAIMKKVYEEARGNPGVRRMRAGLAALGHLVPHKRVHRLIQAAGLRGRHPRAWKRTTIGGEKPVPAPDLIGRDFTAALPGQGSGVFRECPISVLIEAVEAEGLGGGGVVAAAFGDVQVAGVFDGRDDGGADGGQAGGPAAGTAGGGVFAERRVPGKLMW